MSISELEGKHIGLKFTTDYSYVGGLLKIFQIQTGRMAVWWDPFDEAGIDAAGDWVDDLAIEKLQKHQVNTLYTPGTGNIRDYHKPIPSLLGENLSWSWYEGDNHNWGIYLPLDQHYYGGLLKDAGIELKFLGDALSS